MSKAYKVLNGIEYPVKGKERRAEIGDVVTDLPANAVEWLLDRGYIKLKED